MKNKNPKILWEELGNVPINEEEEIEVDFLHFEAGTSIYYIWHWFEEEFDLSVAKDLMKIN
jgi:hypothetical protein